MKIYRRAHALAFLAVAFLSLAVGAQDTKPRYKITDLGALSGFANSRAYGINNRGQVVGQVAKLEPKLEAHAVLWDGSKVWNIATPEGLSYGAAHDINDSGQIVGGSTIENYGSHGFHFMGLPDRAYLRYQGKMRVLCEQLSHAYAINNRGQSVGKVQNRAVRWELSEALPLELPTKFSSSSALAINDKGQVTGIVFTAKNKRQAVLWSASQVLLLDLAPGDDQSTANSINDEGQIVGSSGNKNSYRNTPFVWKKRRDEDALSARWPRFV